MGVHGGWVATESDLSSYSMPANAARRLNDSPTTGTLAPGALDCTMPSCLPLPPHADLPPLTAPPCPCPTLSTTAPPWDSLGCHSQQGSRCLALCTLGSRPPCSGRPAPGTGEPAHVRTGAWVGDTHTHTHMAHTHAHTHTRLRACAHNHSCAHTLEMCASTCMLSLAAHGTPACMPSRLLSPACVVGQRDVTQRPPP